MKHITLKDAFSFLQRKPGAALIDCRKQSCGSTGIDGSVISFTLLHIGVSHFSVRYAIAVLVAFIAAGVALDWYAPGARTLSGAWQVHLARLAAR